EIFWPSTFGPYTPTTLTLSMDGMEMLPMPADPADGCTAVVRLLVAPPNRVWMYPFSPTDSNDAGLKQLLLRVPEGSITPDKAEVSSGNGALSLWNNAGTLHWGDKPISSPPTFTT